MKRFLLLAALGLILGMGPRADADEPGPSPVNWHFDVKVVMVQGATPDMAEKPPAWAVGEDGQPVVSTPWSALLPLLKKRGETTLLLDSMTTTVTDVPTEVELNRARLFDTYERSDRSNEFRKASTINEGVSVKLNPSARWVQYEASVSWILPSQAELKMPLQGRWRVKGTWGGMVMGKTLVLSHREQVREAGVDAVDVELYAFLTAKAFR
jgi:hypothetical protein